MMKYKKLYPISKVDSNDTKIELNCRTVKPILLYFEEKYGRENLEEFIYSTKMDLEYIENVNNWVSFKYFCRLLARLVEYTKDSNAPFIAAAKYSTKKECYGTLEMIFSRLGTPVTSYKFLAEYAPRCVKIAGWRISNLKRNSCTISISYFDKYKQDKNNCLNLQGIFASVPTFWNLPPAKVQEQKCATVEGNTCVYNISWRNRTFHIFGLVGLLIGFALMWITKSLLWVNGNVIVLNILPVLGYIAGHLNDYRIAINEINEINERESKDLIKSIETIEDININLQATIEQRTKELNEANAELKMTLDELRESQNQLIQSEKMASVGRLAAGMAHEINNPVGAIRNYVQDMLEDTPPDDPRWERLKQIEKATGRCKMLVNALLSFTIDSKDRKLVDINSIIIDTIVNAKEEIQNKELEITEQLAPDLPAIYVNPIQLHQVLMNIIMNANDAIEGKGEITIKSYRNANNVAVEISDTGGGIPEDIQTKIFDPFFTTKAPGKGTGLGLAISYNIIQRLNGDIQVRNNKLKGATFIITLPINHQEAEREETKESESSG